MLSLFPKYLENRITRVILNLGTQALGANFSTTVPANKMWLITGMTLVFTADATVANRVFRGRYANGANNLATFRVPINITASQSPTLSGTLNAVDTSNGTGVFNFNLPLMTLMPGDVVESIVANFQPGDRLLSVVLTIIEADITEPTL